LIVELKNRAIALLGNVLVIAVILLHRKMRSVVNFCLANLAVADLCVGVFCVLPNLSLYMSQYWHVGRVCISRHNPSLRFRPMSLNPLCLNRATVRRSGG